MPVEVDRFLFNLKLEKLFYSKRLIVNPGELKEIHLPEARVTVFCLPVDKGEGGYVEIKRKKPGEKMRIDVVGYESLEDQLGNPIDSGLRVLLAIKREDRLDKLMNRYSRTPLPIVPSVAITFDPEESPMKQISVLFNPSQNTNSQGASKKNPINFPRIP